jgi:hypothetical protein
MKQYLHSSHGARVNDRHDRLTVHAVVATLLLLTQVASLIHLAAYPHVLSPDTGKVTHRPCPSDRSGLPDPDGGNDECQVVTVLTQASIVPTSSLVIIAAPAHDRADHLTPEAPRLCRSSYRLSPSHSPPFLA